MELLINKKWLRVDFDINQTIKFIKLSSAEKLIFEEWFDKIENSSSLKEHKINTILIKDSNVFSIEGVFIRSIGDSSLDFKVNYDQSTLLDIDILSLISNNLDENLGQINSR